MSRRSRRQFLEDSMFAVAAAAGASSASQLLAEETEAASSSPNEKLSVAIIGINGRGRSHRDAFLKREDCEITHICDADASVGERQADAVAERQGRRPAFVQDIRKLLEDKSIDIVTIATPNHWHALAAIWAMQAGKDVYCEKPVSHNVLEGRVIVDVARKTGKICQTGTQCRSNPGMRDAMAFIHDGGIGNVSVGRGLCYKRRPSIGDAGNFDPPSTVDYSLWSGPAPLEPVTRPKFHYDWHWQFLYGNGDLGNQGIHQMDLARWGLGVNQLSQSVISYGGRFGYVDAGNTANTQVVIHDYGDKTLVFEVRGLETKNYKGANVGVIFEGSDGYLVMTSYSDGAAFDKDGNTIRKFSGGGDHHHYANFVKAVRSRNSQDLNADILEGHLSSALCHLGNISYQMGETVSNDEAVERLQAIRSSDDVKATMDRVVEHLTENNVDLSASPFRMGALLPFNPETETFVDNATADTMLTREYRAPFVVPARSQV
ncbi:MAG: Gfo/Idh/MocA family oxidoreductase, partial [Planctomycetales bacterium]|nr:Gfo/Idh/MocA family oxidoreductase [Planctomycetales bacterium]MCA9167787.1 Gfo/Idh/MocA family oxidoreductase [Planctomycetales bacterium]